MGFFPYFYIMLNISECGKLEIFERSGCTSLFLALLYAAMLFSRGTDAQFPAVCAENATKSGICCPPWKQDISLVCGGASRGRCVKLHSADDASRITQIYTLDDRLLWPTRFFREACECYGNYAGYMCHECRDGFIGENCTDRIIRVRRNLKSLTVEERQNIIWIMNEARHVESDYVILNMTHSSDPATDPQFVNASVFDMLAFQHYYASRMTNLHDETKCRTSKFRLDAAHRGSNFPIWHRYFMMVWEREMRKVSQDKYFTFPYWNWIDGGTICEHCTPDFLGATNMSDPDFTLEQTNILSTWYVLCYAENECEQCDPGNRFALVRNPGYNKKAASRLPTSEEVSSFMALNVYDYSDFAVSSPADSFRARIEGYSDKTGPTSKLKMHNLVHAFMNGTFSGGLTSSFDPIFYFHHSFMDKLLEIWLRRTGAQPTQLPTMGAIPGHHRDSYLVPFFPVAKSAWYFVSSRELGYDYDDMMDTSETRTNTGDAADKTAVEELWELVKNTSMDTWAAVEANQAEAGDSHNATASTEPLPTKKNEDDSAAVNPLLRYVVIEAGVIGILLVALVSECALKYRYFLANHGYRKLDQNANGDHDTSDEKTRMWVDEDYSDDCSQEL